MPSRKFHASPVKVTGITPDDQRFESALEEDYFFILRFRPDVVRWKRNDHVIEWLDDGKLRRYTPDVLVEFQSPDQQQETQTALIEVKPDFEPGDQRAKALLPRSETEEDNEKKWEAASHYARLKGWTFHVARESEIRTPYLENAKFLMRHKERRRDGVGVREEQELLQVLTAHGQLPLGEWVAKACPTTEGKATYWPACYRMIVDQRVIVDLQTERLNLNSMCRVPE